MWDGLPKTLSEYCLAILKEIKRRNLVLQKYNEYKKYFESFKDSKDIRSADFLGDEEFHISHRSNLLRKNSDHYKQFGWGDIPTDLPYKWKDFRNE